MARGIGNRQKRVVTARKVWVKPRNAFLPSRRERKSATGSPKPTGKSKAPPESFPQPGGESESSSQGSGA
jgi:hypothetical protein